MTAESNAAHAYHEHFARWETRKLEAEQWSAEQARTLMLLENEPFLEATSSVALREGLEQLISDVASAAAKDRYNNPELPYHMTGKVAEYLCTGKVKGLHEQLSYAPRRTGRAGDTVPVDRAGIGIGVILKPMDSGHKYSHMQVNEDTITFIKQLLGALGSDKPAKSKFPPVVIAEEGDASVLAELITGHTVVVINSDAATYFRLLPAATDVENEYAA